MDKWILAIAAACLLCSAALILVSRRKTRGILTALNQMLDQAISGTFTEGQFNEKMLSAIESRLKSYLAASVVSASSLSAEKEKLKALLSDLSHQTKTPLSNILLYTQLLQEHDLPPESQLCVEALRTQGEKLHFLVTSLIKLSRLETGVFTLHPAAQSIGPVVEEVVAQFAPSAAQKGVHLSLQSTQHQGVFDYKWTVEALGNLVENAIKYTPEGGSIQISVTAYDLFCRIDIADSGIGIAEAEQAKIFARFYRSPAVSHLEGAGIGLYLARHILSQQSGYIKVTSSPGNGSLFSVFLPRQG